MAEDIPPNFDRPWSKSDVVLRTANSDGKELHANKVALTLFSPYFDALFSGRFAEKDVTSVDMNCNYDAMKEILRNIHQIDFSYKPNGLKQYDVQMLKELYAIADFYNFPHIRRLCLDQMTERPSVEMAVIASTLKLRSTLMEVLQRLSIEDVRRFLSIPSIDHLFTKNEVLTLSEIVFGIPLPRAAVNTEKVTTRRLNLEKITVEIQNPRIDLTKLWEMADVAILSENSLDRPLYSNKTAILLVSNKFKNLPILQLFLQEGSYSCRVLPSVTVDAEYATMKEILSVIHHCDTNYQGRSRVLHPALLHSMFRAASEDQLDIPMIRDLCIAKLLEQDTVDSFEVLRSLNFVSKRCDYSEEHWRELIFREDEHLSYRKGNKIVVITPSQHTPLITSAGALKLIDVL